MMGDVRQQTIIPPGGHFSAEIGAGERLRLTDIEGGQVVDLISFNRDDPREQLSMLASRAVNLSYKLTSPHKLYSNCSREMWLIEEDTLRENYCGGGYCSEHLNRTRYGAADTANCQDNLTAAVQAFGLDRWSFSTDACLNVFMTVAYEPDGTWGIREPLGKAGDYMVLQALMSQIVAISNCPEVLNACNNWRLKPFKVEILAGC